MRKLVMTAFFFSGFSGLVLENVWVHSLILIFGGTTLAIVTVLTAFMAGLAFGSYLGGKWSSRILRPVRAYGCLEAGVALYALLLPVLLQALPYVLQWLPEDTTFLTRAFVRFVLCLVLLLFPTTLMGATLPILSRYIAQEKHDLGFNVGLLYSMNTFGAVFGAMVGGFVLLPFLGHSSTLYLIVSILFTLGATLMGIGGKVVPLESGATSSQVASEEEVADISKASEEAREQPEPLTSESTQDISEFAAKWQSPLVLVSIGLTGGLAMACQVLWSRALSMIIGSSTYAFTLILSTFLIGLAGGSTWGAWHTRRSNNLLHSWIYLLLATAFLIAGGVWLLDLLPLAFAHLVRSFGIFEHANPLVLFGIKASIAAIPILLPTLCMGAFFPIVLALYDKKGDEVGLRVGKLYAANTLGSILGSAIAGFFLIPRFGIQNGLGICIFLYLLCAGGLALLTTKRHKIRYAAFVTLGLVILSYMPQWNQNRMSLGYFRLNTLLTLTKQKSDGKLRTVYYKEGISTTVSVQRIGRNGVALRVNGKIDASSLADQSTQIGLAALPMIFHPKPDEVMVIGWGSGMTAGAALKFPVKKVTAIELEPAVLEATRWFTPFNFQPRKDPRLQIIYNDGRNHLSTTKKNYDVIISEPSNPWISGVSNLFTVEFFTQVHEHLRPNGIFCQWIQVYELSDKHFLAILASVRKIFPHVMLFKTGVKSGDTLLLASKQPMQNDLSVLRKNFANPNIGPILRKMRVLHEQDLMMRFLMATQEIDRLLSEQKIVYNTDDHNLLEYFAPFDLLYATQKKFGKKLNERLTKYGHSFDRFFKIKGVPFNHKGFSKYWFSMFILMLNHGYLDKASIHFKKFQKAQPKAAFIPKIKALLAMMRLETKAPSLTGVPTTRRVVQATSQPDSKTRSLYTQVWLQQTEKMYKDPKKKQACLQRILPITEKKNFEKELPSKLWFYMGTCFVRFGKYPDALYSFNQYFMRTHTKK